MSGSILNALDGQAGDFFGSSIALSASGRTAIIAAFGDDVGANANQGSARVMDWNGASWQQRGDLLTGTQSGGDAVALSADGNTAMIGAGHQGALVFDWAESAWQQRGSAITTTSYSYSLALSADGNTAVVSGVVPGPSTPFRFQSDVPVMQVFQWNGTDWAERGPQQRPEAADDSNTPSGDSLAISGDGSRVLMSVTAITFTLTRGYDVVSGRGYDYYERSTLPYVSDFQWKQGAWQAGFAGEGFGGPDVGGRSASDGLGTSLDITPSGTTAIFGSPFSFVHGPAEADATRLSGAAMVVDWDGAGWQQRAGTLRLSPTDGQDGDGFGSSVAISDNGRTVVLGGPRDDVGANQNQGSARVFDWDGTEWVQRGNALTPADGAAGDQFGSAVEISADGNTVLVAAPGDDVGGKVDQGSVRSFAWDGTQWQESGPIVIPASLSIAALSADKAEGNGGSMAFTFTVTRSGDRSGASSAAWAVSSNSADAADFAGNVLPSGTVSFTAGETSKTITIMVAGDRAVEVAEGFTVTLSSAVGASIRISSALGTIRNDDAPPQGGTTGADNLTGEDAADRLSGLGGNDRLDGAAGDDLLSGGTGNDTLLGGSGLDTLDGGQGADRMEGGTDDDTYVVDNIGDVTIELAGGGHDRVIASLNWTLASQTERLSLSGTANLTGTGNELANRLDGNTGANTLDGGAGDDALYGGAGNDLLLGGAGKDVLAGEAGADRMEGGTEDDTYVVDNAGDVVVELAGGGNDLVKVSLSYTLGAEVERLILIGSASIDGTGNALNNHMTGNAGANRLVGGEGNDALYAGAGNDTLLGGTGRDVLAGGAGMDRLEGGADDDTYVVGDTEDVLVELAGGGIDLVRSSVSWTLGAEMEQLELSGSDLLNGMGNGLDNRMAGNDSANRLEGGEGKDSLYGLAGADTLLGGGGKDRLEGGLGADSLVGGLAADSFVFSSAADAQGDIIADFSAAQGDRIDLRRIDTNASLAGDQGFAWIGGADFGHVAGQLRFAGGLLAGDMDGNGLADFQITFAGGAVVSSANIWL